MSQGEAELAHHPLLSMGNGQHFISKGPAVDDCAAAEKYAGDNDLILSPSAQSAMGEMVQGAMPMTIT